MTIMLKIDNNFELIERMKQHPYIFNQNEGDLILFRYNRPCIYDQAWDEYTRIARGIVFNKKTGELVMRSFEKFFNFNEVEETKYQNLPNCSFTITDKLDGSLIIAANYQGRLISATAGSFQSDQVKWARGWFQKNARTEKMSPGYTYLFEAIYPENKIVVDYMSMEACVLLSVIDNSTGKEFSYDDIVKISQELNTPVVEKYEGFKNLEDLYQYCKKLPKNREGFVVTFENGLKVKMKGEEYRKIHYLVSYMTPLSYWKAFDIMEGRVPKEYLEEMPEEFRHISDALSKFVEDRLHEPINQAETLLKELENELGEDIDSKKLAETAKERYPKIWSDIMHVKNKKYHKIYMKYRKLLRPKNNMLPDDFPGVDRLRRILNDF